MPDHDDGAEFPNLVVLHDDGERRTHRARVVVVAGVVAMAAAATGAIGGYLVAERSDNSETSATEGAPTEPTAIAPLATMASVEAEGGSFAAGGSTMSGSGGVGLPPLTRLSVREGAGGVMIRAYRQDWPSDSLPSDPVTNPGDGTADVPVTTDPPWTPPDWCRPAGELLVEVSNDAVAVTIWAPWMADVTSGAPPALVYQVVGVREGAPIGVVTGRVAPEVAEVRVEFPDGSLDVAAPIDGAVALAGAAPPDGQVTVEALAADGFALGTAALQGPNGSTTDIPECAGPMPPDAPIVTPPPPPSTVAGPPPPSTVAG